MEEKTFNVLLLGDEQTGKTQIAEIGLMGKSSTETFQKTIVPSFFLRKFQLNEEEFTIRLWDTAGDERFRSVLLMYFSSADSFLLVYDVSNVNSFNNIDSYFQMINEYKPGQIIFLVANTINEDIPQAVSEMEGRQKAEEMNANYAEVNCRTRQGFDDLFDTVLELCVERTRLTGGPGSIPPIDILDPPAGGNPKPSDKRNARIEVCQIQ